MVKSRDGEDAGKKPKARAEAPRASGAPTEPFATPMADAPARSAGPSRRQVRQIARLVGRLEALGELEARRRRQLEVALEKGRKTKRHRQQVDRAVGRVGVLIDRLRTLARELESPVRSASPGSSAAPVPKPAPKPPPKTKTTAATSAAAPMTTTAAAASTRAPKLKPIAARTPAKPAAPRNRSKPANA